MTDAPKLHIDAPPDCPKCGKPVYRRGHMAELAGKFAEGADDDQFFTVCMHCSTIWRLRLMDGQIALEEADLDALPDQAKVELLGAAQRFEYTRKEAARLGMTIDRYIDMIDAIIPKPKVRNAN
jgi:hypothetical protein